jgi:hypothetical protein
MSEPATGAEGQPASAAAGQPPGKANPELGRPRGRSGATAVVLLLTSIIAGIAGWQLIERFEGSFGIPEELANLEAASASPEEFEAQGAALREAKWKDTQLQLTLVGAVMAGLIGLGMGLSRGSVAGALGGLAVGVALGAGGGALAAAATWQTFYHTWGDQSMRAIQAHAAGWIPIAAAAGLAAAAAQSAPRQVATSVASACFAAIIAGALFCPLATLIFRLESPENPIPYGTWSRFTFALLPAVLMGLAITRVHTRTAE